MDQKKVSYETDQKSKTKYYLRFFLSIFLILLSTTVTAFTSS